MLDKEKLLNAFRVFGDPEYTGFDAYPKDLSEVKEKWSQAVQDYLTDIEVITPTITPTTSQAMVTGAVKGAFAAEITFECQTTMEMTAQNIADAWSQAVQAIQITPVGTCNGGTIISITPLVTEGASVSLKGELVSIFSTATADNLGQMKRITEALHEATVTAGVTTCTYQNTAPTPPVLSGPLVFG